MRRFAWLVVTAVGFGIAGVALAAELQVGPPTAAPVRPVTPPRVTVQMTAATLGEDCGGLSPVAPTRGKSAPRGESAVGVGVGVRGRRQCQQTSMQLSVIAPAGVAATELQVKSVELFDEAGTLIAKLTAHAPTVWSDDAYRLWDRTIAPGQSLSVSYALSQPDWSSVDDRWNMTFTLKAVITVGGADETLQRDVSVVSPETSLPPNVRT